MTAQTLALFIAGVIAPILTQWLKRGKIEGRAALYLTFGVSTLLAVVCMLVTGELPSLGSVGDPILLITSILEAAGVVFALATLLYKTFRPEPSLEWPPV